MINAKQKAAPSGKSATSNANEENHTACTCGKQAPQITRKDIFAAVALHALLTKCPTADPVKTSRTCFVMAAWMEQTARAEIGGSR